MTSKIITADEARENTKSFKRDEEDILCDVYNSIKNASKMGSSKVVKLYSKKSIVNIDFCSIVADIEGKGFNVKFVDVKDPAHIEVTW